MFGLDAFHLARIQFAFTVSFHIIFPAITIGLASYLAVLEGLWLKTKILSGARFTTSGQRFSPLTSAWASSPVW
jgi:cytochrome bd-type quinol oxidase subunit 1